MSWKETPVEGMGAGGLWWNPVEAKGAGSYEKRRKGRTNSFRWNSDSVLPFLQGNRQPPKFPQEPTTKSPGTHPLHRLSLQDGKKQTDAGASLRWWMSEEILL